MERNYEDDLVFISELDLSDTAIEDEAHTSNKLIYSIKEIASSFCSSSEEVRKEVSSMSDGVEFMRMELSKSGQDVHTFRKEIDRIVAEGYALETLKQNSSRIKHLQRNNPQFYSVIASYEEKICILAEFESLQMSVTMWLSELDLEITNISHFSGLNKARKQAEFERLSSTIQEKNAIFFSIADYGQLICDFLTYDEDKETIRSQVKSLRLLAEKIFKNMNQSFPTTSEDEYDFTDDFEPRVTVKLGSTPNVSVSAPVAAANMAKSHIMPNLNLSPIQYAVQPVTPSSLSFGIDWKSMKRAPLDSLNSSGNSSQSKILNDESAVTNCQNFCGESEKDSSPEEYGLEWDTSDFSRNISNAHMDESQDDPIPIISPLETAQAPLELLIEIGKAKVESVEYMVQCETPPPTEMKEFNESFKLFVSKAEYAIGQVSKQLLSPSILDGTWKEQGESLVTRWQGVKSRANTRIQLLCQAYEDAQQLLNDVNLALEWMAKNRIFERMRNGKLEYQNETDQMKKMELVQKQIEELKQLVIETRQKESIILNVNIALQSKQPIVQNTVSEERLEALQNEWKDFNKKLNSWKNTIERDIRKSDEYDNVISEVETVLTKIKDKKSVAADSAEVKKLETELRSLKKRVEVLENLGTELRTIEREMKQGETSQELVGFQTLNIIKNICEKELNDFEQTSMINATDEDKKAFAQIINPGVGTTRIQHQDQTSANLITEAESSIDENVVEDKLETQQEEQQVELESRLCETVESSRLLDSDADKTNNHIEQPRKKIQLIKNSVLFAIAVYVMYIYSIPELTYSLFNCQNQNREDCPMEKLRHPQFHLTWPNGPPPS